MLSELRMRNPIWNSGSGVVFIAMNAAVKGCKGPGLMGLNQNGGIPDRCFNKI